MADELTSNTAAVNVDETVNNTLKREATITVFHWTALKLTNISSSREMFFPSNDDESDALYFSEGMTQAIKCVLASGLTAGGETAKTRYIQFDASYLKYQFLTLFRDVLFDCCNSKNHEFEIEELQKLFNGAIDDFVAEADNLIDNSITAKAIKAKDVTAALKKKYSNDAEV